MSAYERFYVGIMQTLLWDFGGVCLPFYLHYLRFLMIDDPEKWELEVRGILEFEKGCYDGRFAVEYLINWPISAN